MAEQDIKSSAEKIEISDEDYTRLLSDIEVVAPSVSDLVDLPGMQPVYLDTDVYIKSSEQKPEGATELASYGQGTVAYPPTPEKDLPALDASIKEDLVIALEHNTTKV